MKLTDTIYALSSGSGMAGIAVVRVSGSMARSVLMTIVGDLPAPRSHALRTLRIPDTGEVLDRAIVVWCPGPQTVTGEDIVEFHIHGSRAVAAVLFEVLSGFDAVRPAEPGEFTRRAFVNGKMDLVEVEGLADLLAAQTKGQWRQAMHQFGGKASTVFEGWRAQLIELLALVEASVDFSEEEGVAAAALLDVDRLAGQLVQSMEGALRDGEKASSIRDGVKVVLAGKPNTGKSSLLNALARRDAAIVSAIPGTTRDVIEVQLDLGGIPVILTDTAGLREQSVDQIEVAGMAKSRREIVEGDVVVWVSAADVHGSDECVEARNPDYVVLNKVDMAAGRSGLLRNDHGQLMFGVSAKTGEGVGDFVEHLKGLVSDKFGPTQSATVVRERQRQSIQESIRFLNDSMKHGPNHLEMVAADLRQAADSLARITGRIDVEDWLGAIFSRFCIGK